MSLLHHSFQPFYLNTNFIIEVSIFIYTSFQLSHALIDHETSHLNFWEDWIFNVLLSRAYLTVTGFTVAYFNLTVNCMCPYFVRGMFYNNQSPHDPHGKQLNRTFYTTFIFYSVAQF